MIRTPRSPMRLLLSAFVVLVVATATVYLPFSSTSVEAGTARRMDVSGLLDASDLAFHGTVLSKRAGLGAHNLIETEYVFQVKRTYWGQELTTRVVKLPGGVLPDGRGLVLAGMPSLNKGEEVLLFLSESSGGGLRMPIGLAQGKFTIQRLLNGSVRLVRSAAALQLSNPATGKIEEAPKHSLFDFAQVQAEVLIAAAARRTRIATGEESAAGAK
ncbi:MAG: hypothetical protein ACI8TQ_002551 [Planctomycetota bacterium]|jgi:hypothetical protein